MTEPAIITKQVEAIDHVETGAACRKWRASVGVSAAAVASKLRISPSMVSDLELGRRNWSDAKLREYAAAVKAVAEQPADL